MAFILIGVLLVLAKLAGLGPMADLSWWWVLSPFPAAAAWWAFADGSGLTQRRAMQKMEDRKRERREKAMAALGLGVNAGERSRKPAPASAAAPASARTPAEAGRARPAAAPQADNPERRDPRL
jgi:small Trp-rich protein